ncbi:hypothetical protein D9O36_12295 [Zobellia amurskyensis]|uniref:Uncharacterized protein n=1 Tax=Zobellia amurskyensis TaxID=248905 RepID=A0A7X2ZUI5_9FLAO|nr:hypothetical protein [Zobellia amurskyensis]MUH36624.1 hypothetical protein [Zobellia amurskyensis]
MKSFLTLLAVLNFGAYALVNTKVNVKNYVSEMGSVLAYSSCDFATTKKAEINTKNSLVRLYMFKENRVRKALAFNTQLDKLLLV